MPTAVKVISTFCILLASVFIANLLTLQKMGATFSATSLPLSSFVNLLGAGTLIIIALVTLLRWQRLIGFTRVLIYALLLVLGLNVILMIPELFSGRALTIIFDLVVIVFIVGVRGYLASKDAYQYFYSD